MELTPLGRGGEEPASSAAPNNKEPTASPSPPAPGILLPASVLEQVPSLDPAQAAWRAERAEKESAKAGRNNGVAIMSIVVSLVLGGLRVAYMHERRVQRTEEQRLRYPQPEATSEPQISEEEAVKQEEAQAERAKQAWAKEYAERQQAMARQQAHDFESAKYTHVTTSAAPPNALAPAPPMPSAIRGNGSDARVPSVSLAEANALLERMLPQYTKGRIVVQVQHRQNDDGTMQAVVTYANTDESLFRFDGSAWSLQQDGVPNRTVTTPAENAPPTAAPPPPIFPGG